MVLKLLAVLLAFCLYIFFASLGTVALLPQLRSCVSSVDTKHGAKTVDLWGLIIRLPSLLESIFLLLVLFMLVMIFTAEGLLIGFNCTYTEKILLDEVCNLCDCALLIDYRKKHDALEM